ncbi:MAG: tetratricopeptide repeat protein [Proteobacteria bacterium]|nr:tetratricopeptide repeat protein [Pseudomonadota bacterium]
MRGPSRRAAQRRQKPHDQAPAAADGIDAALAAAYRHHTAGRIDAAMAGYTEILALDGAHAMALFLMGDIAHRHNVNETAVELFTRAIKARPDFADAYNGLGAALRALGRNDDAETSFRRAIAIAPKHALAMLNLAVCLMSRGDLAAAVELCRQATSAAPDLADTHNVMGTALRASGDLRGAVTAHRRAIALRPDFADAYNNLGAAQAALGDSKAAEASYRSALRLDPNLAIAHNNLGNLLRALGQLDEAELSYCRALEIWPEFAEAACNLGVALSFADRLDDAVACYQRALAINPHSAEAWSNLGAAYRVLRNATAEIDAYRHALAIDPNHAMAHNNLGLALLDCGDAAAAVASFRRALAAQPNYAAAHSNLLYALNFDPGIRPEQQLVEARRFAERHAAPPTALARPHANARDPERRLRVGYVSPDFRQHSCAYFIEPLLAAHDRGNVEIFVYAELSRPDSVTTRLQALADHWRGTVGVADDALAEQIRADGIDILVDLAGHTASNRLPIFAARPAPVQVAWLGYPSTTGIDAIGYRLTDAIADPAGEPDHWHTEALVRLADGFICYRPDGAAAAAPPASGAKLTFGSFNHLSKLNESVVAAWARVLADAPESRLMLKARNLGDAKTRDRIAAAFAQHGIAADRLALVGWAEGVADHLALYREIDVALDSFPYNGTTTTCEALWMGVPVVTLAGDRHAGRVGASLLARVGLDDLVAPSVEAYAKCAVALGRDGERRAALRRELRARMQASPLCDAALFARRIEAAYRDMWRAWCAAARDPR